MSEIRTATISDLAGTGPATLTGQYAAKAWVNFNGTGTLAIRESANVASITDNGTGNYTLNFTAAMPDANYSLTGVSTWDTSNTSGSLFGTSTDSLLTTSAQVYVYQTNSLFVSIDSHTVCVSITR